jgi:hypothetical protein
MFEESRRARPGGWPARRAARTVMSSMDNDA